MARRLVYGLFCSVQSPETGCKGMKKFSNLTRKIFSFLLSLFVVQIGVAKIENIFIRKQEEISSFFLLQHVSERGCKIIQVFRFSKGFKN
jgi:hypothetical protein